MSAELFSVGLAHKVCLVAETQGYTPELLNALAENKTLFGQLLQVQLGHAEIKMVEHLIDCDVDPFVPDGWSVEEHKKGGKIQSDVSKIELWLAKGQQNSKVIGGNKLREELKGKKVLNANVLDYLLAHQNLIPEEWKVKAIFFWGTIYRDLGGRLCVRYLRWGGGVWDWYSHWLVGVCSGTQPAALRAS